MNGRNQVEWYGKRGDGRREEDGRKSRGKGSEKDEEEVTGRNQDEWKEPS